MVRSILMMLMLSIVSLPVFAEDAAPANVEQKAVEVGNKLCPVSGEEVGKMGDAIKVQHNGKIYNLCCSMCVKDFKKDPDKFSKIADDEVAADAAKK